MRTSSCPVHAAVCRGRLSASGLKEAVSSVCEEEEKEEEEEGENEEVMTEDLRSTNRKSSR